jgi:hypothetical protein
MHLSKLFIIAALFPALVQFLVVAVILCFTENFVHVVMLSASPHCHFMPALKFWRI